MAIIKDNLIKDVWFKDLKILVADYIPFGRNSMIAINKKLEAYKKVRDSLISAFLDKDPGSSTIEISPIKTRVVLLKFISSEYSNFISELIYPEISSVQQKEYVGVSMSHFGRIILGIEVQSMENEKEKFYLDYIPRLLTDINEDSSRLIHDLLSIHQRMLIELIFGKNYLLRQKYPVIISQEIQPYNDLTSYLDGERKENEIKQIIEYIENYKEFNNGDKIIIGTQGTIITSKNIKEIEPVIVQFAFARAITVFLNNYFSKIFSIIDEMKQINAMSEQFGIDPRSFTECQDKMTDIAAQCTLMIELCGYLKNSLIDAMYESDQFKTIYTDRQAEIAQFLDIENILHSNSSRLTDIINLIHGLENDMSNLKSQINVIQEKRLQQIFKGIKDTAQIQRRMFRSNERQENKIQILQIILSGSLAIELLNLIVGDYNFRNSENYPSIFGLQISNPVLWFLINIGLWIVLVYLVIKLMKSMTDKAVDTQNIFLNYDRPIKLDNFSKWLESNLEIISVETEQLENRYLKTTIAQMLIDGRDVELSIVYDEKNGYLYTISMEISQPKTKDKSYYENYINRSLRQLDVFK